MRRGEGWEARLEVFNNLLLKQGKAVVARCHPAVRQDGDKWWYEAKAPPDFMGVLTGGRPVVFDAKDSKTHHLFSFGKLPGHQAQFFSAFEAMGGVAFIAARTREGMFVVPWREIRFLYSAWVREEEGAKASIRPGDFYSFGEDGWFSALEAAMRAEQLDLLPPRAK